MKRAIRRIAFFCGALLIMSTMAGCGVPADQVDYAQRENWAFWQTDASKDADVFLVGPTVYAKENETHRMPLDDQKAKADFERALAEVAGVYADSCRVFAPYYRQAAQSVYELPEGEREIYLSGAYSDVEAAFRYYLENENNGRPIVLAGFSQGADQCIRLMKEYVKDEQLAGQIVAVYAIGWRLTEEECQEYPWLVPAKGALDLGSIIVFDAEAAQIESSLVVPEGVKSHSINPLNWRTDTVAAQPDENLGACFVTGGAAKKEIPAFCGAYIDQERGTLKVTGIHAADYPPGLSVFAEGEYHRYDYAFFYNNLKQNVADRCAVYQARQSMTPAA